MTHVGPLLEARGISKRFGGVAAVSDVSLELSRGELCGLIGPNGAGKTTFFNVLSGFLEPTSGQVVLDGADITGKAPAARARRGMVRSFQQPRTFDGLSVYEHLRIACHVKAGVDVLRDLLALPASRRAESVIRTRADQLVVTYGLESIAELVAAELPYGLKKRLGLIMALAPGPSLVLLDEPAAGLNVGEVALLRTDLEQLSDSGVTVLLVEHHMGLVMGTCRRVVVLAAGKVIAVGSPAEVVANERVTTAYLGGRR